MTKNPLLWILVALIIGGGIGYTFGAQKALMAPAGSTLEVSKQGLSLYQTMRELWSDHMKWTYATVEAFYHDQAALQPTLNRLLQNQKDIGAAVASVYGKEAGDNLIGLLTTHIQQAVPVLKAAKSNDKAALDQALSDWYLNANEIAGFLSAANPQSWPKSATEPLMKQHIEMTTAYAVDLLKGDYAKAIKDFDVAHQHMMNLADLLASGMITQFPNKF